MAVNWKDLKREIHDEVEKVWLKEPIEVTMSKLGIFPSGAGTDNQILGNLFFLNADTQAMGWWTIELAKPIAKLIGLNEDETLVFTRSVAYPNNGFVGIPLCSAVFGTEGTVLGSLSVPCATIYMFLFVMQSFRREPEHAACCEKERQKKNDCGGKPWRLTTIKSARWRRSTRSLRGRTFCSTV